MHRLSAQFVLGYHGCTRGVANKLLGRDKFRPSQNDYDWLGHGIYFWEANPLRGLEFATEAIRRSSSRSAKPAVVGVVLDLGFCLDLTTAAGVEEVSSAYHHLASLLQTANVPLPQNSRDQLRRNLDCAVIETLHDIRKNGGLQQIDTVKGVFVEGQPVYEGAGIYEKTHIQICVRNPDCIKGVFRVPDHHLS